MDQQQELIGALQTIPWFQELPPPLFDKIVSISSLVSYEAGQELFREGDKEANLYIVLEGRVAIEMYIPGQGRTRIYTAELLDVVGWSSVTPVVRQRTASARAVLPSLLVKIDGPRLNQLCTEDHDLGYVVMKRMANVIASRLLTTRLQMLDMFAHPTAKEGSNA